MKQNWWKLVVVVALIAAVAAVVVSKNGGTARTQTQARAEISTEVTKPAKAAPDAATKLVEPEEQKTAITPKTTVVKPEVLKVTTAEVKPATKPAEKPKTTAAAPKPAQPKPAPAAAKQEEQKQETRAEQPEAKPKRLPMLLELGADKCIPCKKMKPIIDGLEKEYEGRVDVRFIDVWKTEGVAEKYNIQSIPTQIFFDEDGDEYFRHTGFFSKEDILKVFAEMGVK